MADLAHIADQYLRSKKVPAVRPAQDVHKGIGKLSLRNHPARRIVWLVLVVWEYSRHLNDDREALPRVFFCVEPLLDEIDFVMQHAIRPELKRGPTEGRARLRFVSKLLTYFCGIDAMEQLVPTGQLDCNKPWSHPLQLVRQLANGTELAQLVDMSEARYPSFARDPQAFTIWLDQLTKRVKESLTKPLPDSPSQRSTWDYFNRHGIGVPFQ